MEQPLRHMPQLKGNQSARLKVRDCSTNHRIIKASPDPKPSQARRTKYDQETPN